jgi:hypothetical protein
MPHRKHGGQCQGFCPHDASKADIALADAICRTLPCSTPKAYFIKKILQTKEQKPKIKQWTP